MKLAILGADRESLDLVRAMLEGGGQQLVAAYDCDAFAADLRAIAPNIRLGESWESLLTMSAAEAVIIGRGGSESSLASGISGAERRADQLRKLSQAAVPMVVVCPACEAIIGFEIEMIRRDAHGIIVPYFPVASRSAVRAVEQLIAWSDRSPIGKVEQIAMEREQTSRSREGVAEQLARDITPLRRLIGTVQSISASGPPTTVGRDPLGPKPKERPSLANLSVHFSGEDGLSARWSVVPAGDIDRGKLTVIGERGKITLTMPAVGDWTLEITGDQACVESFLATPEVTPILGRLSKSSAVDQFYDDKAWLAACRDQEAAEAVDRSLARGRTIELFNEEHTEEASFKGVMAMGGCLILLAAVGVLFFVTLVEGLQLPIRGWRVWQLWPVYVLAGIAGFLLLQLLQLAVKRDPQQYTTAR